MPDFTTDPNGYLTFNGLTFTQLINDQLREHSVFTDQDFQGSNLAAIHQTFGYMVSVLMLYLNQSSSEAMFTDSQQLRNINRVVKQLGYNPIGYQTATLAFDLSATDALAQGLYSIPRYSWIDVNGIRVSLTQDVVFAKTTSDEQALTNDAATHLLYQGQVIEHPTIIATGMPHELVFLSVNDDVQVDHFSVQVYVKPIATGKWSQWSQVETLFLAGANDTSYELRYNHNGRYELTFGDNINGLQLATGDQIAIYYIDSDGSTGELAIGALDGKTIVLFDTVRMRQIRGDVFVPVGPTPLTSNQLKTSITIANNSTSTTANTPETATSIRQNAPGAFKRQHRLVTAQDYQSFLLQTYGNLIRDIVVINNDEYLDSYIKYLWDLGLQQPHLTSRPLFHQATFASSCNFNNVYAFVVSKAATGIGTPTYLPTAFKQLMANTCKSSQMATARFVPMDPLMVRVLPGLADATGTKTTQCEIVVVQDNTHVRSAISLQNEIASVISTTFAALKLGSTVDASSLTSSLYNVEGVKSISTRIKGTTQSVGGVSLIADIPSIGGSQDVVTSLRVLEKFMFPYWGTSDISSQIVVESTQSSPWTYAQ